MSVHMENILVALRGHLPTWHGPDFTCNFPQTVLRPTETDQSQISPKHLLCFDSHLLVNISRCSSQHLSVISSKHCLCLRLELRPTETNWDSCQTEKPGLSGTENPDFTRPQSQKCQVGRSKLFWNYSLEPFSLLAILHCINIVSGCTTALIVLLFSQSVSQSHVIFRSQMFWAQED